MPDSEVELANSLIQLCRQVRKVFLSLGCLLLLAGIGSLVWSAVHGQLDKIFDKATGNISTLYSAVPFSGWFCVGGFEAYLRFLKLKRSEAQTTGSTTDLRKINDEIADCGKRGFTKLIGIS